MSRVVHLVVDWDAHDPSAAGDVLRRLALAIPDAVVSVHPVAAGDAAAAGRSVARLTFEREPAPYLVAHDVAAPAGEPARYFCVARSPGGTLVVGPGVRGVWAHYAERLAAGPCSVDVPAGPDDPRHLRLVAAIRHVGMGHSHAVVGAVALSPPAPAP